MPGQAYDWREAEPRWQAAWEEAGVFRARADSSRPKYFATFPYPYVNALLHVGQGATFLHADIMARYKRMQGFNVLLPQAFHATGLPILGAAKRVEEAEEVQLEILRSIDVPEEAIPEFADPLHWVRTQPGQYQADLQAFGAAVDWSRTFITTDQNPPYDAFVKWQFRRLREGGYLRLGAHPVIWCPKDEIPIGDHDRYEGEGETPLEFTLLKFRLRQRYVVAATLRPETVFGTTNVWVDPEVEYVEAVVDGERWIVNPGATEKLAAQGKDVEVLGPVPGAHLVGQSCTIPLVGDPVIILPSRFIDQSIGTGIVSSVPSDAPDDLVALRELQKEDETLTRFELDLPFVKALDPIPIIDIEGYGPLPAEDVVRRMGIVDQMDREKLERAKEEVYRTEYYAGVMNERCGGFAGQSVEEAKEGVKARMLRDGEADVLFEPSGPVVCRCLTPALVKVVEDQWFLAYGDPAWKERVHAHLDTMTLYTEAIGKQFHHVVDWLNDWAATHHKGLGTRLPWDEDWVIESLSDSTAYMAYYTIAHVLQSDEMDAGKLTDALFDYVFLGEGELPEVAVASGLSEDRVRDLRKEFRYWYPFDLRQSGKDLVANHLAFCLFTHVALFPPELWPRAFGVNGMLHIKGKKMSKSKGGAFFLRRALERWGADATRVTLAQGGEGLDDPTFDEDFAESVGGKLAAMAETARTPWETTEEWRTVDSWFRSALHRAIRGATQAMESMAHRTALRHVFFDLQRHWAWYLRRSGNVPNADMLEEFLEAQAKLLAPFAPHVAEEMWHRLGREGLVQLAPYPESSEQALDSRAEALERYLKDTLDDVRQIVKATGMQPKRVLLYAAPHWKRELQQKAVDLRRDGPLEVGSLIKVARTIPAAAQYGDRLPTFCKALVKALSQRGGEEEFMDPLEDERALLEDARPFATRELGAEVEVFEEGREGVRDPGNKAHLAMPWRPAIYLE